MALFSSRRIFLWRDRPEGVYAPHKSETLTTPCASMLPPWVQRESQCHHVSVGETEKLLVTDETTEHETEKSPGNVFKKKKKGSASLMAAQSALVFKRSIQQPRAGMGTLTRDTGLLLFPWVLQPSCVTTCHRSKHTSTRRFIAGRLRSPFCCRSKQTVGHPGPCRASRKASGSRTDRRKPG